MGDVDYDLELNEKYIARKPSRYRAARRVSLEAKKRMLIAEIEGELAKVWSPGEIRRWMVSGGGE